MAPERDIMTAEEAAEYLRIKKGTLQQKVRKGEIPYTPIGEGGKAVIFVKRFLDLWLALVTRGAMSDEIRRWAFAAQGTFLPPWTRVPQAQNEKTLLEKSREDLKAGRVLKLAD